MGSQRKHLKRRGGRSRWSITMVILGISYLSLAAPGAAQSPRSPARPAVDAVERDDPERELDAVDYLDGLDVVDENELDSGSDLDTNDSDTDSDTLDPDVMPRDLDDVEEADTDTDPEDTDPEDTDPEDTDPEDTDPEDSSDTDTSEDTEDADDADDAENADEGMTRAEFLQDPLEDEELDPLLPEESRDRPLTDREQQQLEQDLNALRIEGQLAYNRQETFTAYEIWKRELRLRRLLGFQPEAEALGEIGAIAWADNESPVVNMITARLLEIRETELDPATRELDDEDDERTAEASDENGAFDSVDDPVDYDLLRTVGAALRSLRDYDNAVASYEEILLEARRRDDVIQQEAALNALAELHMGWFRYEDAAAVYQELLAFAQNRDDAAAEELYLTQLARAYDEGGISAPAIATQEQLAEVYQVADDPRAVTALKLATAGHHRALGDYRQAAMTYQEAYALAQTEGQYAYAADALNALADMYLELNRFDDALYVYQLLVQVERQSYNVYGEMETFDRIGQIHEQLGNVGQAVSAYQLGLGLAQSLSFRTEYFIEQINALLNPVAPAPSGAGNVTAPAPIPGDAAIEPNPTVEVEVDGIPISPSLNLDESMPGVDGSTDLTDSTESTDSTDPAAIDAAPELDNEPDEESEPSNRTGDEAADSEATSDE